MQPLISFVFPITDQLANRFAGFALDPSMGWTGRLCGQ